MIKSFYENFSFLIFDFSFYNSAYGKLSYNEACSINKGKFFNKRKK